MEWLGEKPVTLVGHPTHQRAKIAVTAPGEHPTHVSSVAVMELAGRVVMGACMDTDLCPGSTDDGLI